MQIWNPMEGPLTGQVFRVIELQAVPVLDSLYRRRHLENLILTSSMDSLQWKDLHPALKVDFTSA